MGLSVSAIRPYSSVSYTQKVDNAYALENQSEISDSYLDSVKNMNSLADIDPSTPVQYANAQRVSNKAVAPLDQIAASKRASRAFNDLAESFGGATTSYGQNMNAQAYSQIGKNIDLFA